MKIFYLTSRIPFPINKGDKLRAYQHLKQLSPNHEIFLYCLNDEPIENSSLNELSKVTNGYKFSRLNKWSVFTNLLKGIFRKIPFQTSYFFSNSIKRSIEKEIDKFQPDIIFCQLIRMAEYLKDIKTTPIVLDYIDVLSKGLFLRKSNSGFLLKPFISTEYERVKNYEEKVFERFGNAMIITENDRDSLPFDDKNKVHVLPNGIDTEFYRYNDSPKDIDILFVGNMSYPPNVDAVFGFVKNVFPKIKEQKNDVKFYIVGSSPTQKIQSLKNDSIFVTGWVDDVREYYNRAKIFIAPMQLGTGLQNKILEAMSMSLPCVISSLAQKGIQAANKENLIVADDYEEFAISVSNLIDNRNERINLGENARDFVVNNYDWNQIGKKLNSTLETIIKKRK